MEGQKKIAAQQIKGAAATAAIGVTTASVSRSLKRKAIREFLKDEDLKHIRRGRDVYRHAKILSRRNKASLYDARYLYRKYFKNKDTRDKNIKEMEDSAKKIKNFAKTNLGSKEAVKNSAKKTANFAKKHFGTKQLAKDTMSKVGKRGLAIIKRNKKATRLLAASAAIGVGGAVANRIIRAKGFGDNINMTNNYYQEAKRINRSSKKRKRKKN